MCATTGHCLPRTTRIAVIHATPGGLPKRASRWPRTGCRPLCPPPRTGREPPVEPACGRSGLSESMVGGISGNCSGVGQTSGLPVHGVSDSVFLLASKRRARGPANWQTGGLPHART